MLSPLAIAVAGVGENPLLFATDGFIGFDAPVAFRRGGFGRDKKLEHESFHIEPIPFTREKKVVEDTEERAEVSFRELPIDPVIDRIGKTKIKPSTDYEANIELANAILLLEYGIECEKERARLSNDYALVLLLLDF